MKKDLVPLDDAGVIPGLIRQPQMAASDMPVMYG